MWMRRKVAVNHWFVRIKCNVGEFTSLLHNDGMPVNDIRLCKFFLHEIPGTEIVRGKIGTCVQLVEDAGRLSTSILDGCETN